MTFDMTKKLNSATVPFYQVSDPEFGEYGRVLEGYAWDGMVDYLRTMTPVPNEGNIYIPSEAALEETPVAAELAREIFGEMSMQIGYCNGRNSRLNALEYHKSSELDIAATELVLLLGRLQDVAHNNYTVDRLKAFYVPAGTGVELFATTLHFAPCQVEPSGFRCAVVLPRATNLPLEESHGVEHIGTVIEGEHRLLFARNKWLLAHPANEALVGRGAHPGLVGENITIAITQN